MAHPVQAAAEALVLESALRDEPTHRRALALATAALSAPWPVLILAHWRPDPTAPSSLSSVSGLSVACLTADRRGDARTADLAAALRLLAAAPHLPAWRQELVARCAVMDAPGLVRSGFDVRTDFVGDLGELTALARRTVGAYASEVLHGAGMYRALHLAQQVAERGIEDLAGAACSSATRSDGSLAAVLRLLAAAVDEHEAAINDPSSRDLWRLVLPVPLCADDVEVNVAPLTAQMLSAFPSGVRDDLVVLCLPRVCAQAIALVEPHVRTAAARA